MDWCRNDSRNVVYIKNIWDKIWNSRQPYFHYDVAVIPKSEHCYWWITYVINQGTGIFVLSCRQPTLWKADSVPEEDVAKPLYMEVRREVFDKVVRTRDLRIDRELKYCKNMCCRIYGTKRNDVFLPEKKNLGNSQSSTALCINSSTTECNIKYKHIFYMYLCFYEQITNVISQTSRLNFKLISWNIK
jgi:hypothetical protein